MAMTAAPLSPSAAGRILVLGLGNRILCDDAVGLVVADRAGTRLAGAADVLATEESGLALLDLVTGYDRLLIVDAIQTRSAPGTILEFELGAVSWAQTSNPHATGIPEVLELGRRLGQRMPRAVTVLAIEAAEPHTLREGLTPAVEAAVPEAVTRVMAQVRTWRESAPD